MEKPIVDERSFELALHFLDGDVLNTEENRWALADVIQQAVEDWFSYNQGREDG